MLYCILQGETHRSLVVWIDQIESNQNQVKRSECSSVYNTTQCNAIANQPRPFYASVYKRARSCCLESSRSMLVIRDIQCREYGRRLLFCLCRLDCVSLDGHNCDCDGAGADSITIIDDGPRAMRNSVPLCAVCCFLLASLNDPCWLASCQVHYCHYQQLSCSLLFQGMEFDLPWVACPSPSAF